MEQKFLKVRLMPKTGQRIMMRLRIPVPSDFIYPDVYRGESVYFKRRFALIQGGESPEIIVVVYVEEEL